MKVNVFGKGRVRFSEVALTEIFMYEDNFYMKIEQRKSDFNAVSVYTGNLYVFYGNEEVVKVKSTLNIEM
jgi:hypothetical protein